MTSKAATGNRVAKLSVVTLTTAALVVVFGAWVISKVRAEDGLENLEKRIHHEYLLLQDMYSMSASVISLFALQSLDQIDEEERQKRILAELDKLEEIARLQIDNVEVLNYSVVSPYLGSFLHDVGMAREFALMDPPNFKPATGLIESCLLCHEHLK